ncbi:MAG: hypothetical protein AAGJ35_07265, partial [Myxococcota bacterium]
TFTIYDLCTDFFTPRTLDLRPPHTRYVIQFHDLRPVHRLLYTPNPRSTTCAHKSPTPLSRSMTCAPTSLRLERSI